MKAKALAIAGALSVVSIALPLSAKAHENADEKWFMYTSGAFAALCDLHSGNAISTEIVQAFQKNWMADSNSEILRAKNRAVDDVLDYKQFKACPLRRY